MYISIPISKETGYNKHIWHGMVCLGLIFRAALLQQEGSFNMELVKINLNELWIRENGEEPTERSVATANSFVLDEIKTADDVGEILLQKCMDVTEGNIHFVLDNGEYRKEYSIPHDDVDDIELLTNNMGVGMFTLHISLSDENGVPIGNIYLATGGCSFLAVRGDVVMIYTDEE